MMTFADDSKGYDEEEEKYDTSNTSQKTRKSVDDGAIEKEFSDEHSKKIFEEGLEKDRKVEKVITKYLKVESYASSILKDDKIEAMFAAKEILSMNLATNEETVKLIADVQKYAPYAGNKELEIYNNQLSASFKSQTFAIRSTYNPTAAVAYAHTWAHDFNTSSYPNLSYMGGDCANFVSQCLVAGGASTDSTWYINKLNDTYLTPGNPTQLDTSWDLADPSPWISAEEFTTYWTNRADRTVEFSGQYVYDNTAAVYQYPYHKGDAVQIIEKKFWWYEGYHTMIITGYDTVNSHFLVSYHSNATKDKDIKDVANSYKDSKWSFRFYAVN